MKRCSKCKVTKPRSEFNKDTGAKDGLYSWCQACARADSSRFYRANRERYLAGQKVWRDKNRDYRIAYGRANSRRFGLKSRYGLSIAAFDEMLVRQDGLCGICAAPLTRPNVDHDHVTGRTRGLLCTPCNQGVGFFRDDVGLLRSAIRYIEGPPKKT